MNSPYTGKPMLLKKELQKLLFRKEEFSIVHHTYHCKDSGENFESEELLRKNLAQVHNQYRVKHNLPFPEEIKKIREKYGVSALQMAKILNFGVNMYRNYEHGEMPNLSNARLIQLVANPSEFKTLIKLSDNLNERTRDKLLSKIDKLILSSQQQPVFDLDKYLLGKLHPDEYTGYRCPDLKKFFYVLSFFAETLSPWKVKMCKLLFYADFSHFKKFGISLSGIRYIAITMGPVPNNFDGLFNEARQQAHIKIKHKYFQNGGSGEQFVIGDIAFDPNLFSADELQTLEYTAEKFKSISTKKIIELSHKEDAWIECFQKQEVINYKYGFSLKGDE